MIYPPELNLYAMAVFSKEKKCVWGYMDIFGQA